MSSSLGFIMLRHVNSPSTNQYWQECYMRIRTLYPDNWILIIDDHSVLSMVDSNFSMRKCKVIHSEFPQAGELLGYYYFHKTRLFSQAVIIHDSVFLQQKLPTVQDPVRFLWHFTHSWDNPKQEKMWLAKLRHSHNLLPFYERKKEWWGCFGAQSMIQLEFLDFLEKKYGLFEHVLPSMKTRVDRMCMERVLAVLCTLEFNQLQWKPSFLGDIHKYGLPWGYDFKHYRTKPRTWKHLPAVKVWTGR